MNVISKNIDNLAITFSKQEVEDFNLVLDCCLDFDFEGEDQYYRMEKAVLALKKIFDEYQQRYSPKDLLVP